MARVCLTPSATTVGGIGKQFAKAISQVGGCSFLEGENGPGEHLPDHGNLVVEAYHLL